MSIQEQKRNSIFFVNPIYGVEQTLLWLFRTVLLLLATAFLYREHRMHFLQCHTARDSSAPTHIRPEAQIRLIDIYLPHPILLLAVLLGNVHLPFESGSELLGNKLPSFLLHPPLLSNAQCVTKSYTMSTSVRFG